MNCMLFIDYDNLSHLQKTSGVINIVTKVLMQMPFGVITTPIKCEVRIYGGWYEGTIMTRLAQDVTVEIQRDFPTIIRLPRGEGNNQIVFVNANLAVALIQEPGHHLLNTYRRKGKPANIRVEKPTDVGCTDSDCVLPLIKNLLKMGNCPKTGCKVLRTDLVYRHEQKIVDTMLSCDLIYAANSGVNYIALVSSDDDFLPPLRMVLLYGIAAVRFHPKPNSYRASFPPGKVILIEKDL